MEEERSADAEGPKEMWVLNWVKQMWMEMGCFQSRRRAGERELFLFKGEERAKGNNSHSLPRSPHL